MLPQVMLNGSSSWTFLPFALRMRNEVRLAPFPPLRFFFFLLLFHEAPLKLHLHRSDASLPVGRLFFNQRISFALPWTTFSEVAPRRHQRFIVRRSLLPLHPASRERERERERGRERSSKEEWLRLISLYNRSSKNNHRRGRLSSRLPPISSRLPVSSAATDV